MNKKIIKAFLILMITSLYARDHYSHDDLLSQAKQLKELFQTDRTTTYIQQEKEFSEAIKLAPGYTFAHSRFAHILLQLNKPHEAIKVAQKAIDLDILNFDARLALGIALRRTQKLEHAIAVLEPIIIADHLTSPHRNSSFNRRVLACHQIAMAYSNLHNLEMASIYYAKAIALDGTFLPATSNLAFIHYNRGNNEKASDMFEKYITNNPHAADGTFASAILYAKLKNLNKENGSYQEKYEQYIQLTIQRLDQMPDHISTEQIKKQLQFIFNTKPDYVTKELLTSIHNLMQKRMPHLFTKSTESTSDKKQ